MTQRNRIKLRHVVPSIVTVFAICSGMTAIRMTLEGRLETGLAFVLLAVFLDAADGKLARFLDSASPFGAELDTLADFFNFGIVPGVLIYHTLYLGTPLASLGWLSILVLVVCLLVYPWPTLILADCVYLLSLPFSYRAHKKHCKVSPEHAHSAD